MWLHTGIKCGTHTGALSVKSCISADQLLLFAHGLKGKRTPDTSITGLFCFWEHDSNCKNDGVFLPARSFWCWRVLCIFGRIGKDPPCNLNIHSVFFSFPPPFSGRWKDNSGFPLSSESIAPDRYVRRRHQNQAETAEKWCVGEEQQFCEWNHFPNESYIMKDVRTGYSSWSVFYIARTIIFLSCGFYTLRYLYWFM